ncbi:hypothetical protein [Sphingomonas flavescens]|jgi:ribosomal protein L12E/L44/L45/RPP1/RPP2|uniref:hypothetical protein n=1 Tax=Sphingomonas flavescens TaxID=3132797 RepID=UPI002805DA6D|nr:hypothetical protein [Sphingomonas limnosediminicola]
MRKTFIGIAALLLSACGGTTYEVAPVQAFEALSSIGTAPGMDSLPGGLNPVHASFESIPGDNAVVWQFTHEGEDIGRIIAKIDPKGDNASVVNVYYVDGTAPGDHWRNDDARRLIKNQIQRLAAEAVDAKLTGRPFDEALKKDVQTQVTMSSAGAMMNDANARMDEAAASFHQADEEARISRQSSESYSVGKPATDLSGGSNR